MCEKTKDDAAEIEIIPEMIEAGIDVLSKVSSEDDLEMVVKWIYEEMFMAKNRSHHRR